MKKVISLLLCILFVFSLSACGKEKAEEEKEKTEESFMVLDEGNIVIEKLEGVDGLFVEKGNQDEVKNVSALVIKNNSEQMLEYLSLSFRVNTYERADFTVSALPAGEKVIVMESFARAFNSEDKYEIDDNSTIFTYCEAGSDSEAAEVKTDGANITVKNKTAENINATVVYKYYKDGMYYGGIAFRGKFEDIIPGGSVTKKSDRFNESCKIVNVVVE